MTKNITDDYAKWMYARIKRPATKQTNKVLPSKHQAIFRLLCGMQEDGHIEIYREWLSKLSEKL